jgi:hypothetical protein
MVAAWAVFSPTPASAAPDIYASPISAGCYIVGPSDCRIHVEPFTINVASGQKMVTFKLLVQNTATGLLTIVYDWKPDVGNPPPYSSPTQYTPSLVATDFGATCGRSYSVILEGQDTGDAGLYSLGSTASFTCPSSVP